MGSGCRAEPRVGESIRSEHKDRNKLVKIEDRPNECEHPIPINHQEIEAMKQWQCATAVLNRTLKWFGWFVFVWFQTIFFVYDWKENGIPVRYVRIVKTQYVPWLWRIPTYYVCTTRITNHVGCRRRRVIIFSQHPSSNRTLDNGVHKSKCSTRILLQFAVYWSRHRLIAKIQNYR